MSEKPLTKIPQGHQGAFIKSTDAGGHQLTRVRAEILTYLTRKAAADETVSAKSLAAHFLRVHGIDEDALNSALADLRNFGFIQIDPSGIGLALLGRRLSR